MTTIDPIGAAIDRGTQDDGCKDGPYVLPEVGVLGRLQTWGTHAALVHGIELAMSAGYSRSVRLAALPGVAGFLRALGDATVYSVHQGHVPAVIGGDHSCVIGTRLGVANALQPRESLGLIWIDVRLGSHTPQTSDSGVIHDMSLAALLGHGAAALTQIRDTAPKLLPEHVVVIGARSYEPAEHILLDSSGARIIDVVEVVRNGLRAVMVDAIRQVKSDMAVFGVIFDLDAFDPAVTPGVDTPETGGLTAQGIVQALVACARDARFAAFELVEYNPHHDKGEITTHPALDLPVSVADVLHAQRREYTMAA